MLPCSDALSVPVIPGTNGTHIINVWILIKTNGLKTRASMGQEFVCRRRQRYNITVQGDTFSTRVFRCGECV